jgi:hypothetical protein
MQGTRRPGLFPLPCTFDQDMLVMRKLTECNFDLQCRNDFENAYLLLSIAPSDAVWVGNAHSVHLV